MVYAAGHLYDYLVADAYEVLEWIAHTRTAENADNQFSLPSPGR